MARVGRVGRPRLGELKHFRSVSFHLHSSNFISDLKLVQYFFIEAFL